MFRKRSTLRGLTFICVALIMLASCTSTKNLAYFQDLPSSSVIKLDPMPQDQRVIESGDEINIVFIARDDAAAAYFNKAAVTNAVTNDGVSVSKSLSASMGSGLNYLVDPSGNLEFPEIGRVKVSGLTASQLKEALTKMVANKLKDPIVEVRFNNFRVSVIGDVRNPGTYMLPMQKPTLLEALAAAGDLTITANRMDVQLYRDYNGERKISRLDLRKKEVLSNPDVFLMKHNDVLIVKPATNTQARENLRTASVVTSVAIGLITLVLTITNNN